MFGTGFEGDCGVNILLDTGGDSEFIGHSSVGQDGDFNADVAIPAGLAPGMYRLQAEGLSCGVEFCGGPSPTRL